MQTFDASDAFEVRVSKVNQLTNRSISRPQLQVFYPGMINSFSAGIFAMSP